MSSIQKHNTVARFLSDVRSKIGEMPLQRLQAFLLIASRGDRGTDHQTLIHELDMSRSQASKVVSDLSFLTSTKEKGPDLVDSQPDPMNLRSRIVKLTPKGRKVYEELMQ